MCRVYNCREKLINKGILYYIACYLHGRLNENARLSKNRYIYYWMNETMNHRSQWRISPPETGAAWIEFGTRFLILFSLKAFLPPVTHYNIGSESILKSPELFTNWYISDTKLATHAIPLSVSLSRFRGGVLVCPHSFWCTLTFY